MGVKNYRDDAIFLQCALKEAYYHARRTDFARHEKSEFDEVTSIDLGAEQHLIHNIEEYERRSGRKAKILSEENRPHTKVSRTSRFWTIDPIDGTFNLVHGLAGLYGVQAALVEQGEIAAAAIYLPAHDLELAASLDDDLRFPEPLPHREVRHSLVALDALSHDGTPKQSEQQIAGMKAIAKIVQSTRVLGSCAYQFVALSTGQLDAYVSLGNPYPWDLLPGILICKARGCLVINRDLKPYRYGDDFLGAFNGPALFEALTPALKEVLTV